MITASVVLTVSEKTKDGYSMHSFRKYCEFHALPRADEWVMVHDRPFTVDSVSHIASPGSGVTVTLHRKNVDSDYVARIIAGGWESIGTSGV